MSQTTQATKQHTAPIRQQSSSVERCASFVVCQQIASIALVVESATPDPSALHPFCSGAALHNGCTAPQRVQRHTALQRHSTQSSTNHHTRQDKSSSTHNGYRPHNSHNTSSNTPDPSALHPSCSGAAPHNGCSATRRSNGTAHNQAPTTTHGKTRVPAPTTDTDPTTATTQAAIHPIHQHYTPSVRV